MAEFSQSIILQAVGWAVINSLWQIGFFWALYRLLISIPYFKLKSKTLLVFTFLVLSFIGFIITLIISLNTGSSNFTPSLIANFMLENPAIYNWAYLIFPIAAVLYLFLLLIPVYRFIQNFRYVNLIRFQGLHRIDSNWKFFIQKTAGLMEIKRKVEIWLSEFVTTPVTVGFLKPVILIPVAAINNLSQQQVEAIILHELGHIKRNDYFLNFIIRIIHTFLYFNPFVKFFVNEIEKERETRCDELVIQFNYKPFDYASALLVLQKTANNTYYFMMAAANRSHLLLERIENILGVSKKRLFTLRQSTGFLVGLLTVLFSTLILNSSIEKKINPYTFSNGYNPYYFFAGIKDNSQTNESKKVELIYSAQSRSFINQSLIDFSNLQDEADQVVQTNSNESFYKFADFTTPVIVQLEPSEEEAIKETIDATKKVLKEKEWKNIENNYAEVFTDYEKGLIKHQYQDNVNHIDWNKLENKLRLSYEQLNWGKINNQLQSSLTEIRLDSIQSVLTNSINNLQKMESWMIQNHSTTIPDTDLSIEVVKELKEKAQMDLEKIKNKKEKKIIKI